MSLKVKVVGQRSRSQRSKVLNFSFSAYYQKMGSIFKVTRSRSEGQISFEGMITVSYGEREVRQPRDIFI